MRLETVHAQNKCAPCMSPPYSAGGHLKLNRESLRTPWEGAPSKLCTYLHARPIASNIVRKRHLTMMLAIFGFLIKKAQQRGRLHPLCLSGTLPECYEGPEPHLWCWSSARHVAS
jgi:hypothetical protein